MHWVDAEWQAGASRLTARAPLADIPEEEARYWAKKLEQLNAMRDQDEVRIDGGGGVGGRAGKLSSSCVCLFRFLMSSSVCLCFSLCLSFPISVSLTLHNRDKSVIHVVQSPSRMSGTHSLT